ncbi:hypothetical protein LN042_07540 [Kitasatospora sp. RB6PN24]|uniref:hypothetical protein n=1 Tax=Kitasatospora humi TaxID=2893891 RepID=UPI001E42DECA|nr:hypothetical protein [Kitasatospora humi]MCC9306960.1 hypothetical protein [Kitasatospora humi]
MSTVILAQSFDQAAALSELRSLGRELARQAAELTRASEREMEATLRLMKKVHLGIVASVDITAS